MYIAIIGSYGSSNIGDEAILEIMIHNLKDDDIKYIFSGNPALTTANLKRCNKFKNWQVCSHLPFGFRSFFRFTWFKSIKFLAKSDIVLLGGGGLFTDSYTIKAVFLWSFHVLIAKLLRKKIILLANSVGPLQTKLAKNITRWSLNQCQTITVRDTISKQLVNNLLPNKSVILVADPVFLYLNYYHIPKYSPKYKQNLDIANLSQIDPVAKQIKNYQNQSSLNHNALVETPKLIALSVRDWPGDMSIWPEFINYCRQEKFKILLIPMELADEIILRPWQTEGVTLVIPQNLMELAEILAKCEWAIGMRLHFLITASLVDCKVGGIAYSSKVNGILQAIKVPYLTMEQLSLSKLQHLLKISKTADNLDEQKILAQKSFFIDNNNCS